MSILNQEVVDKIWTRVTSVASLSSEDCWNWIGGKDSDGYGIHKINSRSFRAHRVFHAIYNCMRDDTILVGKFSAARMILHKCDNPSCINPNHLYEGTGKQNTVDRELRGRWFHRGENSPAAKITEAQVLQMREEYKTMTGKEIAKKHKVPISLVYNVVQRHCWKHV